MKNVIPLNFERNTISELKNSKKKSRVNVNEFIKN